MSAVTSLSFEKSIPLERFSFGSVNAKKNETKQASLSLTEKKTFQVYQIDPDNNGRSQNPLHLEAVGNTELFFNSLLKTKSKSNIVSLFYPLRTHTAKDFCLDFCIPLTRRVFANIEEASVKNFLILIGTIALDILTIIARLFTAVFAWQINKYNAHPLKQNFANAKVEALYVTCTVDWTLKAYIDSAEDGNTSECSCKATLCWRVDLVSPLFDKSSYDNGYKDIVSPTGNPSVYEIVNETDEEYTHRNTFCDKSKLFEEDISHFSEVLKGGEKKVARFLPDILKERILGFPKLTFI